MDKKEISFFRFVTKNFDLYREKKFLPLINAQEIRFFYPALEKI